MAYLSQNRDAKISVILGEKKGQTKTNLKTTQIIDPRDGRGHCPTKSVKSSPSIDRLGSLYAER